MDKNFILSLKKDENWRFSKLEKIKLFRNTPSAQNYSEECICSIEENHLSRGDFSIIIAFVNGQVVNILTDKNICDAGVKILQSNLNQEQSYFDEHLGMSSIIQYRNNKERHLIQIEISQHIHLEKPILIYNLIKEDDIECFPEVKIKFGVGTNADICEYYVSKNNVSSLCSPLTTIELSKDACCRRTFVQNLNEFSQFIHIEKIVLDEDAKFEENAFHLGGQYVRTTTEMLVSGENAYSSYQTLNIVNNSQEIDWRTIQRHIAPNSKSKILCKNALLDDSRTIFSGNILVEKDAQKTQATQSCKNLILSENASAFSMPGLEIDANDVKCSHGATTGSIDKEELFYLQQRGLPEIEARKLLTLGFMNEVINSVSSSVGVEYINNAISQKFSV